MSARSKLIPKQVRKTAANLRDSALEGTRAYELVRSLSFEASPRLAGSAGDRAGVEWVNAHAPEGATYDCVGVVTHTCDGLRQDITYRRGSADFVIRSALQPGDEVRAGYEEVYRESVSGVPITLVFQRLNTR